MSRARPINFPGGQLWFDRRRASEKATPEQLETLAAIQDRTLDDLLDEGLTQGEVLERLRIALGQSVVPPEVLERKRAAREAAKSEQKCRICSALGTECEGCITRHHFVPRWLMLKLDNYQAYAARRRCTIPICVGRHRDLHLDGDQDTPKSISQFMTYYERRFAQKMLDELYEQIGPNTREWLDTGGSGREYDIQLISDYHAGLFRASRALEGAEIEVPGPCACTGETTVLFETSPGRPGLESGLASG